MTELFARNIVVIYFVYGLAYFSMGLAIWLVSTRFRTSEFRLAYALLPLAAFGILHGLHEWFEMFELLDASGAAALPGWLLLPEVSLVHLVLSFLLLVLFGVRLLYEVRRGDGHERQFAVLATGAFLLLYVVSVLVTWWVYQPSYADMLNAADVLSRYTLGIPGAVLAAWAIWLEQRNFRKRQMPEFGRALLWAAAALFLYGVVGQLFTRPSFLFPSTVLNSQTFIEWYGFPVQLLRTVLALIMAYAIIRALNAFEVESRRQLEDAREQRRLAQQQALHIEEQARKDTEQLNRELETAVKDLSLLFSLSSRMAGTLDRVALLDEAAPILVQALPQVNAGMLMLRREPDDPLEIVSIVECNDPSAQVMERKELGVKAGAHVADTGEPVWVIGHDLIPLAPADNVEELLGPAYSANPIGGHTIAMPLVVQGTVTGALVLCTLYDSPLFTRRDVTLMRTIAHELSIALENATLYAQVEEHGKLRGELLHRAVNAQEAERQRVARELHDGTGQTLTALGLGLAVASDMVYKNPDMAQQHLNDMRQLNDHAQQELQDVLAGLRPSILDNLGLVPALRGQIQQFGPRSGTKATLRIEGHARRLKPDVETTVFRIAQEALTNVAKHAQATHVDLCLDFAPDRITLTVVDDGQGFEMSEATTDSSVPRAAWGLLGIQERAALAGGTASIHSAPGEGTTIELSISNPYPPNTATTEEGSHG